jgi:hypothetical protein
MIAAQVVYHPHHPRPTSRGGISATWWRGRWACWPWACGSSVSTSPASPRSSNIAEGGLALAMPVVVADHVSKKYRLYRERNASLKATVMRGRRSRVDVFGPWTT